MNTKIKSSLQQKKTMLLISIACIFSGILACLLGDIALPLVIGTLSAIYLFDTTEKRPYSICVSVVLLVINALPVLFGFVTSLFSPAAIIISYLIAKAFIKGQSKADAAYLSTLICALFTIVTAIVFVMIKQGVYTLDAVVAYYKELGEMIKTTLVDYLSQAYQMSGLEVSPEELGLLFDQEVKMTLSYLFIGGFLTVGLGMKLFGVIVKMLAEEKEHIAKWRFGSNRLYAYFYVALIITNLFISSLDSAFSVAALNLYTMFSVVFAYIGFKFAVESMRMRGRSVFSIVILVLACIFFF
ncbi:MAG: hypothetical protein J6V80_02015, partial [Clostridia bacterium]|nr:hypothetical protein [Clostridia bacterium]